MCGYIIELLDADSARDARVFRIVWWLGSVVNITGVGILLYQVSVARASAQAPGRDAPRRGLLGRRAAGFRLAHAPDRVLLQRHPL